LKPAIRRMLSFALGTVAIGYLTLVLAVYFFQDALIYFPRPEVPDPRHSGFKLVEEVSFTAEDGVKLHGWLATPRTGTATAALVLFHGNGGNVADRGTKIERFARAGWASFCLDWRGYGKSEGTSSEAGLYADGRAALAFLRARFPRLPLIVYGESLGTGVAVELAQTDPPAVLALESPYTSFHAMARYHYPFLPAGLILRAKYDNLSKIGRVKAPLVVIVGEEDKLIPPAMGRALHAAANEPKELLAFPGVEHNDFFMISFDPIVNAIRRRLPQRADVAAILAETPEERFAAAKRAATPREAIRSFRPGDDLARLEEVLGKPASETGSEWAYEGGIRVSIAAGKIVDIEGSGVNGDGGDAPPTIDGPRRIKLAPPKDE
jgi:fermentation-respiration switch protein FrsA (DUF1100 family)